MPRYDVPKAAPEPLRLVQRFVNTTDVEHGQEWLATPSELERWLAEVGRDCDVSSADVRRAHELREALRQLLVANNARDRFPPEACATVNRFAKAGRLTLELDACGALVLGPRSEGVHAALGEIVAVVFRAILDRSFERLKACRNCRWAFYDYSRSRGASWCSMSICGNRLKTRRYRARKAAATALNG